MNVFVSEDVTSAALNIRLANIGVFLALTTALAWLLPAHLRVPLIAGWTITMVPLTASLIASTNPGSWGIVGVGSTWLAAMGWFQTSGKRSYALGALTALSVLIAAGSRTDAAVYSIIALGIASFLSFANSRSFWIKLSLPLGLVLLAASFYVTSGYSTIAEGGLTGGIPEPESRDPFAILAFNLISIPQLWTGVFGSWGLGWRMEIWPGFTMVEFASLAVFIGLASLGIARMFTRKAVMLVALMFTLYAVPVYILTIGRSVVGENVQPRYIVPLVVLLAGVLLLGEGNQVLRPGRWHIIPAIILLTVGNTIALYGNIRRYVTGFDVEQASLSAGAEWWWEDFPLSPNGLWILGSVAFGITVLILGRAWLRLPLPAQTT